MHKLTPCLPTREAYSPGPMSYLCTVSQRAPRRHAQSCGLGLLLRSQNATVLTLTVSGCAVSRRSVRWSMGCVGCQGGGGSLTTYRGLGLVGESQAAGVQQGTGHWSGRSWTVVGAGCVLLHIPSDAVAFARLCMSPCQVPRPLVSSAGRQRSAGYPLVGSKGADPRVHDSLAILQYTIAMTAEHVYHVFCLHRKRGAAIRYTVDSSIADLSIAGT